MRGNREEWQRVLRTVGYEAALGTNVTQPSESSALANSSKSSVAVTRISQVLESGDPGAGDCNLCNRSFVDKHGLKKHTNMVHSEEGDLPHLPTGHQYDCSDCHRTFGYLVNLKKHRQGSILCNLVPFALEAV